MYLFIGTLCTTSIHIFHHPCRHAGLQSHCPIFSSSILNSELLSFQVILTFQLNAADATANDRFWNIKVTQIPCYTDSTPDNNCQQYFTGVSGSVKSFNYDEPIATSQLLEGSYDVSYGIK